MNIDKLEASTKKANVQKAVDIAMSIRTDSNGAMDADFNDVCQDVLECSFDELLEDLGIDPSIDTIAAMHTTNDFNVRYLIPEIIRKAIRVGLRQAPIWPAITAMEMDSPQKKVTMPFLNMSDAAPKKVNEAETIPVGSVSYGDKSVEVFKMGRGIKIPYEVVQYVSIDVVSIFLQDFGIKLGYLLDNLAIDTILNGDQADGSASAPIIGVTTPGTVVYRDLLRPWVRGSRMGRKFSTIIGSEEAALETLDLPEFKTRYSGTTQATLDLKTPVPNSAEYYVHGAVPDGQQILLDKRFCLVKINVVPLLIESTKIIQNQTLETYATFTSGFAKLFLDAALILDQDEDFATDGFPVYMDVDAQLEDSL